MLALLHGFRLIALLEGASFIILLGIAMPLKYWGDMPVAVRIAGSIHGALFVAYAIAAGLLYLRGQWTFSRAAHAMGVSLVPFATFVFDRSLKDELAALERQGQLDTSG